MLGALLTPQALTKRNILQRLTIMYLQAYSCNTWCPTHTTSFDQTQYSTSSIMYLICLLILHSFLFLNSVLTYLSYTLQHNFFKEKDKEWLKWFESKPFFFSGWKLQHLVPHPFHFLLLCIHACIIHCSITFSRKIIKNYSLDLSQNHFPSFQDGSCSTWCPTRSTSCWRFATSRRCQSGPWSSVPSSGRGFWSTCDRCWLPAHLWKKVWGMGAECMEAWLDHCQLNGIDSCFV